MPEPKRQIAGIVASVAILLLMAAGAAAMRGASWLPVNVCLSCDDLPSLTAAAEPQRPVATNSPAAHSEHMTGAVHQSDHRDGDDDVALAPAAVEARGHGGNAGEGAQGEHDWTSHGSTPLIRGAANDSHAQGPRSAGNGGGGGFVGGGASTTHAAPASEHAAVTPAADKGTPAATPAPARPSAPPAAGGAPSTAPKPPAVAPPAIPAAAGGSTVAMPTAPVAGPLSDDPFLPVAGPAAFAAPTVAAVTASPTPEPASLFLLGTGILGVWTAARRRR